MHPAIPATLALVLGASLLPAVGARDTPDGDMSARCTLVPGRTQVLLRVERDTTLPFRFASPEAASYAVQSRAGADTMLATSGSPMPAARVRLLKLDDATRAELVKAGITDSQPVAFIRAAPYGAECSALRWTDSLPWVRTGDIGYARATLAPRDAWVAGVPVLVIPDVWAYPYPRSRGLAYHRAEAGTRLASAEAMYSLHGALDLPREFSGEVGASDSVMRARAMTWARANLAAAELPPARGEVQRWILGPAWKEIDRLPSRLRGSYRVTVEADAARGSWYFRTFDRPNGSWREVDSARTIEELLTSPDPAGYQLVGDAAGSPAGLVRADTGYGWGPDAPRVWLNVADARSVSGAPRTEMPGELWFNLAAAPSVLWDALEPFIPPLAPADSAFLARTGRTRDRAQRSPRLPLTVRVTSDGAVRGEGTVVSNGRRLRVLLERIDTVAVKRPW